MSSKANSIRYSLRLLGAIVLIGTIAFWLKTGAHTGFSKNRVEVQMVDPVTQIEYVDYEERFVMGVEYLTAGSLAGLVLIGTSFTFGRKK